MTTERTPVKHPAPKHPAPYSPEVLRLANAVLRVAWKREEGSYRKWTVLDPFAGIGRVHELDPDYFLTFAVELEPEWAEQAAEGGPTWCGDFFRLQQPDGAPNCWPALWPHPGEWDVVMTSPTYGNRMADSHTPSPEDTSTRVTYTHRLGRKLTEGNSGAMQWGDEYRDFHERAWVRVGELLKPGGLLVLNIKDHVRGGRVVPVTEWHGYTLKQLGFRLEQEHPVLTRGMRFGANSEARVDHEWVLVWRWPG